MPETILDPEDVAKTLEEHMKDALAAECQKHNQAVMLPFFRHILEYAEQEAIKWGSKAIEAATPAEHAYAQAQYRVWEKHSHGGFMLDALNARYATVRAEFSSISHAEQLKAAAIAGAYRGDSDPDGPPTL